MTGLPKLPPMWSLGWHQSRFGYTSVEEVAAVVANYSANGLPLDTMWTDIDYMDSSRDFTFAPSFPAAKMRNLTNSLHVQGQHLVLIIEPYIASNVTEYTYTPFQHGLEQRVFVTNPDGSLFQGKQQPNNMQLVVLADNTMLMFRLLYASFPAGHMGVLLDPKCLCLVR